MGWRLKLEKPNALAQRPLAFCDGNTVKEKRKEKPLCDASYSDWKWHIFALYLPSNYQLCEMLTFRCDRGVYGDF